MSDFPLLPKALQSIAVRPLDKGMFSDRSPQTIPDGGFARLEGWYCGTEGLRRRGGSTKFASGTATLYPHDDMATVWALDGTQYTALLTEKSIYRLVKSTGLAEVPWAYSTGTIASVGGAGNLTVTGSGTGFAANDIQAGDIFRVNGQEGYVASVTDATHFQLQSATITPFSGHTDAYSIQRAFGGSASQALDWAVVKNKLLVADGSRALRAYDPTGPSIAYWTTTTPKMPSGAPFLPKCVCFFQDYPGSSGRVWTANMTDALDGTVRTRMRFSSMADLTDFSLATSYVDVPYTSGEIRRLVPHLGALAVYLDDAVYLGLPTNYPVAPLRFERVETGGIGLAGSKAVCSWLGGHWFAGQDDIYYLRANGTPERVGSAIVKESLGKCSNPAQMYAVVDPAHHSILFGMPESRPYIERIWAFDYRSKAWSSFAAATDMIANPYVRMALQIDDLSGTIDNLGATYPTIDSFAKGNATKMLFLEGSRKLWQMTDSALSDRDASPIQASFETKDYDFGLADTEKAVTRFSLKIDFDQPLGKDLNFLVELSTNRGRTWMRCGTLFIADGKDEGHVDFRAVGSTLRFRASIAVQCPPFTVSEHGMQVRSSGEELALGAQ